MLRITNYLNSRQNKLKFSGIIKSQFSYCRLSWMFSSRKANNSSKKIHERTIQKVSDDNESNLEKLLEKIICPKNLQVIMIEVYKIISGYA